MINGTSKTTDSVPEWDEKVIFWLISSGKFTPLHVTMRDESASVQESGPGLIAF